MANQAYLPIVTTLIDMAGAMTTLAEAFNALSKGESAAEEQQETPTVTYEQVRAVLTEKSRAGKCDAVKALLLKHGAPKLSEISEAEYSALLAEAEQL